MAYGIRVAKTERERTDMETTDCRAHTWCSPLFVFSCATIILVSPTRKNETVDAKNFLNSHGYGKGIHGDNNAKIFGVCFG